MEKAIYFDMDGTIADLYNVQDWLPRLRAEDPSPYLEAEPLVNLEKLAEVLRTFKSLGYTIGIITWLSLGSSEEYKRATRKAKAEWLSRIPFEFDEIHMVKYGTEKHLTPKVKRGILVDDNEEILRKWQAHGGLVIDAKVDNWLTHLQKKGE